MKQDQLKFRSASSLLFLIVPEIIFLTMGAIRNKTIKVYIFGNISLNERGLVVKGRHRARVRIERGPLKSYNVRTIKNTH